MPRAGIDPSLWPECDAEGCVLRVRSSGARWCETHYYRMRRNGTMDLTHPQRTERQTCRVEGCDLPDVGPHELCAAHNARQRRYGDPTHSPGWNVMRGPGHPMWLGDDVSYSGAHSRVRSHRGSATMHPCVDCGDPAKQWSYDRTDPAEKQSDMGPYSADVERYAARCVPCHKRFDLESRASTPTI